MQYYYCARRPHSSERLLISSPGQQNGVAHSRYAGNIFGRGTIPSHFFISAPKSIDWDTNHTKGSRNNKLAFWRERRAGRCKAPRRRRCGDIVEERQRSSCPPAAAPRRAAGSQICNFLCLLFAGFADLGAGSKMPSYFCASPKSCSKGHITLPNRECVTDSRFQTLPSEQDQDL
jgi:hypothetical protein